MALISSAAMNGHSSATAPPAGIGGACVSLDSTWVVPTDDEGPPDAAGTVEASFAASSSLQASGGEPEKRHAHHHSESLSYRHRNEDK